MFKVTKEALALMAEKLPSYFGVSAREITLEELHVITIMNQKGWILSPCFYGEKSSEGVKLQPCVSWFNKFCKRDGKVFQYSCCVNYDKLEVLLYNSERLIATFPSLSDLFDYFDNLNYVDTIHCTGCNVKGINTLLFEEFCENGQYNFSTKDAKIYNENFMQFLNFEE